ncbi:MAG: U32 family peptidase C-terminal domain-containing protein, partial [Planctomycetales bacterium]
MVRRRWPDTPIHLSVQANAVNFATVQFWQSQGLSRVILSRELAIPEIAEIQRECPGMELEVFVHGALCIAYSGRCLLSGYLNHRDPNQGSCTNSCRWNYNVRAADHTPEGNVQPIALGEPQAASACCNDSPGDGPEPRMFLLEEQQRPGELMPAFEDEHGTYIMNSRDLRAVEHVEQFVAMGLSSLKIEGRTKTHFYAARTAQVYRRAIDDAAEGRPLNADALRDLDSLSNRGYTDAFYSRRPISELQNYDSGASTARQQLFVGELIRREGGEMIIDVKNKFSVGDELELMTPSGNAVFSLAQLRNNEDDEAVKVAPGSGHVVRTPIPNALLDSISDHDVAFGLLMRTIE